MSTVDVEYQKLIKHIKKHGTTKDDRTGTGTISVFSPGQMRFNLQEGFPLLQLKHTSFKLVFGELKWMMIDGSTSNTELEEKYGVRFWRHWQDEVGELPNIYGKQVVRSEGPRRVVKVKKRILEKEKPIQYPLFPLEDTETSVTDNIIGYVFPSKDYGDFVVLSKKTVNNHVKYKIQFLYTGFTTYVTKRAIDTGKVKDPYYPSVFGIGFLGEYKISTDLDKKIYNMWKKMIEESALSEETFVCNRWLNFSNFRKDVEYLPNWHKKKYNFKGYELDKDYYGSNAYSPDICVFSTKQDKNLYQSKKFKPFMAVFPNGSKEVAISTTDFARDNGILKRHIQSVLSSGDKEMKKYGFKFYYIEQDPDYVYRYQLPVNQLQRVIEEIKSNPTSRRLVIDNWSAYDLEHQALPACHAFVQFYVNDGKLSCLMYQRSVDVMLGLPYNIAFYSLLTHMIAHVTGLEVGEFIHCGGDTHIYNNLMSMADEVLNREPRSQVQLRIKRKVTDIRDFTLEDFELIGYNPHPVIKGAVSV